MASVTPNGAHPLTGRLVVTGGGGFLGSQVVKRLRQQGASDIVVPRSFEFDLVQRENCRAVVQGAETVVHLAARVGGIGFNRENPGQLFFENLMMGAQLMEEARLAGVGKFVAIGTICAYPKFTPVPFHEDDLWDGYPEETNAPYGLAKKMMLVQAQSYRQQYGFNAIFLLPANLYGPGDNFDPETSHVIPALVRKFLEARDAGASFVEAWGTGKASREFLYVSDCADAVVRAAAVYNDSDPMNIGTGSEITIADLAETIARLTGFAGEIRWRADKPDGQPRRRLDVSRAREQLGFEAQVPFEEGLRRTIEWYEGQNRAAQSSKAASPRADQLST